MNNIQKSFKNKAKCGIRRSFNLGGVPNATGGDPLSQLQNMQYLNKSGDYADKGEAGSTLPAVQAAEDASRAQLQTQADQQVDSIKSMSGLSQRQKAGALAEVDHTLGANGISSNLTAGINGLSQRGSLSLSQGAFANQNAVRGFDLHRQQQNIMAGAYADGGTVGKTAQQSMDEAEALLARISGKNRGLAAQAAPAPAPAPAPVAAPVQQAAPSATVQGAYGALTNRGSQLRSAIGFANGGIPSVDAHGFIHGPGGVDNVPARVAETGEEIRVGQGERIVNQKQNAALEQLAQSTTGQPLDSYLEDATGKPVGPQMKRGLRAAENGKPPLGSGVDGMPTRTPPGSLPPEVLADPAVNQTAAGARANHARSPEFTKFVTEQAAADAAAGRLPSQQAAPEAGPKPMMEPLEVSAAPAAAEPTTIRGQATKMFTDAKNGVADMFTSQPKPPGTPITDAARRTGKFVASPLESTNAAMNTKTGKALGAAGVALQVGDHFDAFDSTSGLTPVEKGQILLRDAGVLGGGALGATGGAAVGSVVPVAGSIAGGVAGGVAGASAADTGMGYARRGLNWANGQMGGDPNYWQSSDDLVRKSRAHQQAQPDYKEGAVQKTARSVNEGINNVLEKVGVTSRQPLTPVSDTQRQIHADAMAGKGQDAGFELPKIDKVAAKRSVKEAQAIGRTPTPAEAEANAVAAPNVAYLRDAGVTGDVRGDLTQKEVAKSNKTPNTGIRTINTANGAVYAGRDGKGQLNVVSNLGNTDAQNEAARAKEATRMQADTARQVATFDKLNTMSDLNSNFAPDRKRGLAKMAMRGQEMQNEIAKRHNDLVARGQDTVLQGHQLDTQAKMATLQNQQIKDQAERHMTMLDNIYGKDGKDNPRSAERQKFISDLTMTLGANGRHIGHLSPQDFTQFATAHAADQRSKGNTFEKLYKNWIDGHPEVEDYNPFHSASRASGDAGKTNAYGYYRDGNGVLRSERDLTGKSFLYGTYDAPTKRQLDQQ